MTQAETHDTLHEVTLHHTPQKPVWLRGGEHKPSSFPLPGPPPPPELFCDATRCASRTGDKQNSQDALGWS